MEREINNACVMIFNSEKARKEPEEEIRHSFNDVKSYIFGKNRTNRDYSEEEEKELFQQKASEFSFQNSISNTFNRITYGEGTNSIYNKCLDKWEQKYRKIVVSAGQDLGSNYNDPNCLLCYKPI